MSFSEFLLACGDENLTAYLESLDTVEPLPDAFFNPLYEQLKMYFICDGLPEVVLAGGEDQNVDERHWIDCKKNRSAPYQYNHKNKSKKK